MDTIAWATKSDIEAAGCGYPELSGYERTCLNKLTAALLLKRKAKSVKNGIVLGINPYTNDVMMHDGPQNVLVMGACRSGKGINTVIPTSALWQRNLFCFEKSSDLWNETADYRKHTLRQRVLKFSPLCEDSAKWNPLGEVRLWLGQEAVSADIRVLADSIIYCSGTGLPVMDSLHQKAASFLAALIAYLFAAGDIGGYDYHGRFYEIHTVPYMYELGEFVLDKDAAEVVALLKSHYPTSKWCPEAATFLKSWKDDEVPSDALMQVIKDALKPYCNPMVQQNTSASDFRLMELIESDEPLSIYYCLDGQWNYRGIASLFVNMMFYKFSLSKVVGELQSKCLVMLDDAIELSYLPQIEPALVISAAHGVRVCLVMQNNKQLEGIFGQGNQIAQHCGVHVYFRTDPFCGESTLAAIPNLSVGKVITPEEILRLDLDKVIVFIEGHQPILARKLRYFDNPWLKKMCGEGVE